MNVSKFLRINKPRFRHFMALKESASDLFARMRLPVLRKTVSPAIRATVSQQNMPHRQEAEVYRWFLRGLPVEVAIRKVRVDMKVARNVRKHR